MNYLAAQDLMVARLRATLPNTIPVRTALDLEQIQQQAIGQPEVWVTFHQDVVADHSGEYTLIEQRWVAAYVAPGLIPDAGRDGEALSTITKALAGYDAGIDGISEFSRVGSMLPQRWTKRGLIAYGLLFSVVLDL
jgi:hypothetical protein